MGVLKIFIKFICKNIWWFDEQCRYLYCNRNTQTKKLTTMSTIEASIMIRHFLNKIEADLKEKYTNIFVSVKDNYIFACFDVSSVAQVNVCKHTFGLIDAGENKELIKFIRESFINYLILSK